MTPRLVPLALALLTLLAQPAAAQETFTSLAGPWWFKLGGEDRGALLLELGEPVTASEIPVVDVVSTGHPSFGFSRDLAAFFKIATGQMLSIGPKGGLSGALELSDADSGDPIATLTIDKSNANKGFTRLRLKGTLAGGGGMPMRVVLAGVRPDFPVLTGRTAEGRLRGKGVKSNVLDLSVLTNTDLGLPAYSFEGMGPALIDGMEVSDASVSGRVMLDPKLKAQGLLEDSSHFGTGPVWGRMKLPDDSIPRVYLLAEADGRLKLRGGLTEAVEPILAVTPTSFDFPATALTDSRTQDFAVTNIGVGTLSGEVSFRETDHPDFQLSGATSYSGLMNGDPPVQIEVTFQPVAAGTRSASLLFSVDSGAGAKIVQLTGIGGIGLVSVDPDPIGFLDTTVGMTQVITVTVTNDGDGPLTGQATLQNATSFALLLIGSDTAQTSIPYTNLAPNETHSFRVRFQPLIAGAKTGMLKLTGGSSDVIVDISGTGL